MSRKLFAVLISFLLGMIASTALGGDYLHQLQDQGISTGRSDVAHWGPQADKYSSWTSHSNRLIPVYSFGTKGQPVGIDLNSYTGENSIYRSESKLRGVYGKPTEATLNPTADYMDQTNIFDLQKAALDAGKKNIFLVVFDGMDWQSTQAAAIWNTQEIPYTAGRGRGTHFQEYQADGTTQFGLMVTSPFCDDADVDVNKQIVKNSGGGLFGGYDVSQAGSGPWEKPTDILYLIGKSSTEDGVKHSYTDSASSATSMMGGIKTYNAAIGVGPHGERPKTIAHLAQEQGYVAGAVTSVPISHATPASAYAYNVSRNDYQDISRDMLGLPSASNPDTPLRGLDVVIGSGYGVNDPSDRGQGDNYVSGNKYLADDDLKKVNVNNGGKYVVATRTSGADGKQVLAAAAAEAAKSGQRLLGYFGVGGGGDAAGHLPFCSAEGDFHPALGVSKKRITYDAADLAENPSLVDMTRAAIEVLSKNDKGFWLLVESGDVDWANHANNLDASIGAVNSGDAAVKAITDWVEQNSNWNESVLIVTADHGHYMFLDKPELLIRPENR
ncbi:alkaline phosphatase [Blastopirellula sp. J2-11]|uniref:alkaline phosphatase n=1 Tax=Blastopirellula sp. J2-11 TaxID=2943192 RepID=UPI0021C73282|nr:alkaline phosphatase [Blastopirellula sp. J2-11]UUO08002.1 alkaline phosphatase [Blastopirellula sp. J2-11]